MSSNPYADPDAMRNAIADRLRPIAKQQGIQLTNLQRQFAYDRLLCRIFKAEPDRWVLKGAAAILARLGPDARHTRDIDLLSRTGTLAEAERALNHAAALDLGDYFKFTLSPGRQIVQGEGALRVDVLASLGVETYAKFHVDLVADHTMTGTPEPVTPLVKVDLPGLTTTDYYAYPMADHVADKVCALLETHRRASGLTEPSTRVRDLVDLVTFAHTISVKADELRSALTSEAIRRQLDLPEHFPEPPGRDWPRGYANIVRDLPKLKERQLPAAVDGRGGGEHARMARRRQDLMSPA